MVVKLSVNVRVQSFVVVKLRVNPAAAREGAADEGLSEPNRVYL